MNGKRLTKLAALTTALVGLTLGSAQAAVLKEVRWDGLAGASSVGFDSLGSAPAAPSARLIEGLVDLGPLSIGERFQNQTVVNNVVDPGGFDLLFDRIEGTPSSPLSLLAGLAQQNLAVSAQFGSNLLLGVSAEGDTAEGIGEGAISILFDEDQSGFGFAAQLADLGNVYLQFFRRDGSLIEAATVNRVSAKGLDDSGGYAFELGKNEIAGVNIWNDDGGGMAFGALRFARAASSPPPGGTVPEPMGLALAGLALALAGQAARRRR